MNISGLFTAVWLAISSFLGLPVVHAQATQATVLFGGDMMFDRTVRTTINNNGSDFIFSCIDPLLKSEDLVVANLEGPITDNPSISELSSPGDSNNFTFTFPLTTATLLHNHNIRLVNLGNNHIENFGTSGVQSTTATLTHAGVNYFGDPIAARVATTAINGIPFAFINYNEFAHTSNASTTVNQIIAARQAKLIPIVYTHWGVEYEAANDNQKMLAHEFVDAGAEMVIGSHPHVVQEHEVYKGKYIYYSLGNFFFDQYWNDAVSHGLLLEVTVDTNGVQKVKEIPVVLQTDRKTCPQNALTSVATLTKK